MVIRRTTKRTAKNAASDPAVIAPKTLLSEVEVQPAVRRETPWSELPEDSFTSEENEEAEEAEAEEPTAAVEQEEEDSHAPDDALGLYLRQMGAIPLLSRDQELALAERLELKRRPLSPCRHDELAHAGGASWTPSSASRLVSWPWIRPSTW